MADEQLTPDRPNLYHYKLDLILGRGGTGTVYRGIDTKKGEAVAIKRFHESFFRNALHLRDLKKSIKKFKKFEHPNVVKILGFHDNIEYDGYCMVMEYVDGPNLKWYIINRPWDLQERLEIIKQICLGLQYLHDKGCVHHDFKPANVLFTRRGQVKLADFSLFGNSILLELLDRTFMDQITPMFVAPEMIRKEKPTAACDQYSLGITMYMMFALTVPYIADSLQKIYQSHLRTMPTHPSLVNPDCPRPIGDLIMKLLAKNPKDRFACCDQVRIAISNLGRSKI